MEKIGKAYDDKIQKDSDGKWSWSQFWTAMEAKAINLVGKYLDQKQKTYRKHQRDNNSNGKTTRVNQKNTGS